MFVQINNKNCIWELLFKPNNNIWIEIIGKVLVCNWILIIIINTAIFRASYIKEICEIKCRQLYLLLSPWGVVFLYKLIVAQLVSEFLTLCVIWKFDTVFLRIQPMYHLNPIWSAGRELNPRPLENETGLILTLPRHSEFYPVYL